MKLSDDLMRLPIVEQALIERYGTEGFNAMTQKDENKRILAGATRVPRIRYERLYKDTQLPLRATEGSAGYDLYAHLNREEVLVKRRDNESPTEEVPGWLVEGDYFGNPMAVSIEHGDLPAVLLRPGDKAIIPLGFKAALPPGYEAQIRPRSGTSFKTGLDIPNSPGTIDPDYRGEWGVIVKNASGHDLTIQHGERIAQMVLQQFAVLPFEEVPSLDETERLGGFGSTGAR